MVLSKFYAITDFLIGTVSQVSDVAHGGLVYI